VEVVTTHAYVIRDAAAAADAELHRAPNRSAALHYLRRHVNVYAAVRLLDVADGLRPDDGVPRPVTVKRED
jgi:predicted subunit of tRNA(5-methylaminomethyl-2-thiouridylate) methyltransferase